MKKENRKKVFKAGLVSLVFVGFVSAMLLSVNVPSEVYLDDSNRLDVSELRDVDDGPVDVFTPGDLGYNEDGNPIYPDGTSYHVVAVVSPLSPLGENDPGHCVSGWNACFMLDYAETPATCLATNASGGGYDSWGNVSGYADNTATFDAGIDLASNDPAYFVCRGQFNESTKQDGSFNYSRYRCWLNCTGDETVSAVAEFDNSSTATGGDAEISADNGTMIWVNWWWDDQGAGADGYRITDDGSLSPVFTIEARY